MPKMNDLLSEMFPKIVQLPQPLDFLFRQESLTEKDYYQFIENLADIIYNQRESIVQKALGDINWRKNLSGCLESFSTYNIPEISGLPLSTRALWFWQSHNSPENEGYRKITVDGHTAKFRNEISHIWGYTRDGDWAIAEVSYLSEQDIFELKGSPYRQILKLHTETVQSPQDVARIAGINASGIFWKIVGEIKDWHKKRQELYKAADKIDDQISAIVFLISRSK